MLVYACKDIFYDIFSWHIFFQAYCTIVMSNMAPLDTAFVIVANYSITERTQDVKVFTCTLFPQKNVIVTVIA